MLRLLTNWSFYSAHAWRETYRLKRPLVSTISIVCGFTVPTALLLGLTAGLVRQQEQDVQKSPSAAEIDLLVTSAAEPLTPNVVQRLTLDPRIEAVIEDITKVVDLNCAETDKEELGVTVRSTKPGDRLLGFYGADVLTARDRGIVLSTHLADLLGIDFAPDVGRRYTVPLHTRLTLSVARQEGSQVTMAAVDLAVRAVADFGTTARIAYLHRNLLDSIEDFQQGRTVNEYGWPGFARSADVGWECYLAFSKQPLQALDELKFRANGLTATLVDAADPEQEELRTLYGLLEPHSLNVYRLHADGADAQSKAVTLLTRTPADIERISDVDDVVLPWSTPLAVTLDDEEQTLVGLTVRKRWLKSRLKNDAMPFSDADDEFAVRFPSGNRPAGNPSALALATGQRLSLAATPVLSGTDPVPVATADPPNPLFQSAITHLTGMFRQQWPGLWNDPTPPPSTQNALGTTYAIAIAPASLLAHLRALDRGDVRFDEQLRLFVDARSDNAYYQARVIATDIHAVPALDEMLRAAGYATQSQRTRVEELQGYAETLRLLVYVVGGTVLLFGIWTLTAALAQDTARKKRSIASLLQMGASKLAIFYIVLVRGLLIGLTAGIVTVPFAIGLARLLTQHVAACLVSQEHLLWVFAIAVGSCLLGVIGPALRATWTDPSVVFKEGDMA